MDIELICLLAMLGVFLLSNLLLKLPVSISMVLGALAGAIVGGEGIPLRHLFEGTFTYVDTMLIISSAMLFMTVIQESGALEALNSVIVTHFYKYPALMLIMLMLVIMFPGMITGSSTAAVLSAGALVAPVLLLIGIPKEKAGAIIAIGSIMGMAAPPINIPAMLIGGGVDMPYIGFDGPLLLLTIPCAVFSILFLGLKHCRNLDIEKLESGLDLEVGKKYGFKLYIPILALFVLLIASKAFPAFPQIGTCLIFLVCAFIGLFTGRKFNFWEKALKAMDTTIPVLAKLMGVGMFIQIMTLVGARGWIVVSCLSLGIAAVYIASFTVMPAFGAISSYGAASVLGVPFLLVMIQQGRCSDIVVASCLSFLCCLGDLMPPTALAGNYAAQIVGLKYKPVLIHCIVPFVVCIAVGLAVMLNSLTFA
ncbi:MAG: TRAP transporter large permease subunit [Sphaerochaetaceae bacterium]|nr:TRAP transporter large permease subunit [Sphaerochaetaceae bacterium]MDD3162899.1 TRAP transporter large permease subunit [Sphaerochaetaceae bacterium]MDD4007114.1 TRAP transporter large permease subunit [Sphaerochaetaceae bacterium]MDD4397333.1 TRAP transporter large permease subunit [Sphaerochaetaceae bacterium]